MKNPTVEDLRRRVESMERHAQNERIPLNLTDRIYMLSHAILGEYMGEDWINSNVWEDRSGSRHLTLTDESEDRQKAIIRVITLAETLYNLQDVEGFLSRIPQLRRSVNVESAIAEIQGAAILHSTGCTIRFRETGYDLDILLSGGNAAAEIKCKLASTEPSRQTVKTTLDRARQQLPRDWPGFVFLNPNPPKEGVGSVS